VDEILPDGEDAVQLLGNPAGDCLSLYNKSTEQAHLNIFDLTGKHIFSGILPGGSTKNFNVHSLSTGMYIINAQLKNHFINLKFIKL